MTKRFWAMIIKQSLLLLAVVFFAGVVFDHFTNDAGNHSPMLSGLVAVGIYLVVIAIVGLLNLISGGLYLWLFGGMDMTAGVLDELRQLKIPAPRRSDPKNYDYLAAMADDETADAGDRVKAAVMVGSYSAIMRGGIFKSLAIRKALDEAILRYAQEAPHRSESDEFSD